MGVLAAVHGRTAKELPQVYQRIFRLEQLVVEIVTPKHQFILIITGIALLVVGGIALFGWLISSNSNTVEGKRYTPTGEYALLDLGSTNCEPCKKLQPVLAELREEYGDKIEIVFFDITGTPEGSAMANGYKVNVMPTLLFVDKNGNEVKRLVGFRSREQIEGVFKELGWIE